MEKCKECGSDISGRRRGAIYCSLKCSGRASSRQYSANNPKKSRKGWREYSRSPKGIATQLIGNARRRAKSGDLPMTITHDWVLGRLKAWRCELTGLEFQMESRGPNRANPFAPSLDRIEPSKGYVEGNVRLVCYAVNMARSDWGDEVLLIVARALVSQSAPSGG